MQDGHAPVRTAEIVDFAAFRARLRPEQPSLFEGEAPHPLEVQPARRRLSGRAVEHRARMLRHLTASGR
jgi:hypothetical protein